MSSDAILIYCGIWLGTTFHGAIPNSLITFLKGNTFEILQSLCTADMLPSQEEVIWPYTWLGWVVWVDLLSAQIHTYIHWHTVKHLSDTLTFILAHLPTTALFRSLCLSSLCVLLEFQTPELLKMHSVTVNLISFSFADCYSEDTYHAFCFSFCHRLSTLHHPLSSLP